MAASVRADRFGDGSPEVHACTEDGRWEAERLGHHADDFERPIVEQHPAAHDVDVTTEALAPQPLAEHDDLAVTGHILRGNERAADPRSHAHHVEEAGRHADADERLGIAGAGQRDRRPECDRRHARKRAALFFPRWKLMAADAVAFDVALGPGLPDDDELVRVRIGQRLDQYRVDDAEHRCGGADRQPHQQHDRHRHARRAVQKACGVAQADRATGDQTARRRRPEAMFAPDRGEDVDGGGRHERDPRHHATRSRRRAPRAKEVDHFVAETVTERRRIEVEQSTVEAIAEAGRGTAGHRSTFFSRATFRTLARSRVSSSRARRPTGVIP